MNPTTLAQVKHIEEASLNAWPGLKQILLDGWILRFANGYTRRANSVSPIYSGSLDAVEKIKRCEQLYRDRQLTPVFKITPFVQPANLDALLAQAGYQQQAVTSVQQLTLANLSAPKVQSVRQWRSPDREWVADYARLNGVAAAHAPTLEAILQHIALPTCFVLLTRHNQTVACGLGVLQGQQVGLFDLVTLPEHRRQGFATDLILHILQWARQRGATTAYLQVMLTNRAALNLYNKLGFKEIYQYWYQVFPGG